MLDLFMTLPPEGGLLPRIIERPNAFIFGCISIVLAVVVVTSMVGWMIMGELDPLVGIIASIVVIMVSYWTMQPPYDWMAPVLFFLLLGSFLAYPILTKWWNRQELKSIDADDVENLVEHLRLQPTNYLKMANLAQTLYDLRLVAYAIGIMHRALALAPKGVFTTERGKLKAWEDFTPLDLRNLIQCRHCGATPNPDDILCPKCQADYLGAHFRRGTMGHTGFRRTVVGWSTGLLLLFAMISVTAYGPMATIVGVPLMLFAGGLVVWRTWHPPAVRA